MVEKKVQLESGKSVKYSAFILNKGYVESSRLSECFLSTDTKFDTVGEALKTFGMDLLNYLMDEDTRDDGKRGKTAKTIAKIIKRIAETRPPVESVINDFDQDWIEIQIEAFMDDDMDGRGYFLIDQGSGWNCNNWGSGLVIHIQKAPEMIARAMLGTLGEHEQKCFFTSHKIKVLTDNHKIHF